ncbi:cytochrome C oxidase subunit IV family protein [Streptomyces sp. NPDC055078]
MPSAPAPARKPSHAIAAWAVLMTLTAVTWAFADHHYAGVGIKAGTAAVLILAYAKVYVVGHTFMEHRHSAPPLRIAFALWCTAACLATLLPALL